MNLKQNLAVGSFPYGLGTSMAQELSRKLPSAVISFPGL